MRLTLFGGPACLLLLLHCGANPNTSSGTTSGGKSSAPSGGSAGSGVAGSVGGTPSIVLGGSSPDSGGDAGSTALDKSGCGDGVLQAKTLGEACDDGNNVAGDGCSADCLVVEQSFACLMPGEPCSSTVACGDGKVSGTETCDDGNTGAEDGCDAVCSLEPGWICPTAGERCQATACGDGIIAGVEQCEDDDAVPVGGDGCSAQCAFEPGYECATPGAPCKKAVCGDGVIEGGEPCDDQNQVVGDGCSPSCEAEPMCDRPSDANGCSSRCGDGLLLNGDDEECDDGNARSGDGCSATCQVEDGYSCKRVAKLPDSITIPFVFRDFVALPSQSTNMKRHPDFQARCSGLSEGMVSATLDSAGKPVNSGTCNLNAGCTLEVGPASLGGGNCAANESCSGGFQGCDSLHALHPLASHPDSDPFELWYRDTVGVNVTKVVPTVLAGTNGTYQYDSTALYPFDQDGWVESGDERSDDGHNYGFTSEVRRWFEFTGGELLTFNGDDDVWVFINGKLALDIGGVHGTEVRTIRLNANGSVDCKVGAGGVFNDLTDCQVPNRNLGLQTGRVYEIALFHAERHTTESNFRLSLTGFVDARSTCEAVCGDGTQTPGEACDAGGANDNDAYAGCTKQCKRGPRCGDGTLQAEHEACDDGDNITPYSAEGNGCAPGCKLPSRCGDAQLDGLFGEECDDGTNPGGYGACNPDCTLGPRCGDDVIDEPNEACDDGNSVSGDGCSSKCTLEAPK